MTHFQQKWLSLRCIYIFLYFIQKFLTQCRMIKKIQSVFKVCSQTSSAYLGSWQRPNTSLAVHCKFFVLIQWTSQQVSPAPVLIWPLRGFSINYKILSRILSASFHRHMKHRQICVHSKLWSNCLNLAVLITHKARIWGNLFPSGTRIQKACEQEVPAIYFMY